MTEPIKLYDADAGVVLMYSPTVAEQLVSEGKLFVNPPEKPEPPKTTTRRKMSSVKKDA